MWRKAKGEPPSWHEDATEDADADEDEDADALPTGAGAGAGPPTCGHSTARSNLIPDGAVRHTQGNTSWPAVRCAPAGPGHFVCVMLTVFTIMFNAWVQLLLVVGNALSNDPRCARARLLAFTIYLSTSAARATSTSAACLTVHAPLGSLKGSFSSCSCSREGPTGQHQTRQGCRMRTGWSHTMAVCVAH